LYENAKKELKQRAIELGYLAADYEQHVIRVERRSATAAIELVLATGPLHRFGPTTIEGALIYPRSFLQRYLVYQSGEVFSYFKLGQTQRNLLDSERFLQVDIIPHPEQAADSRVPVNISLIAAPPKRLRPGFGYGTDTGVRSTLRYRDLNLRGRGQELESELVLAELRQALGVGYVLPSAGSVDSRTVVRASIERENLEVFDRAAMFTEVERIRSLGAGRLGSIYSRLLDEDFAVGEEDARSRLLLGGLRFSERVYDNPTRPRNGHYWGFEARGTTTAVGSDVDLLQLRASANSVIGFGSDWSLIAHFEGGVGLQRALLEDVPPSLRFFAGGDQSVRGYAFQSLGTEDENGDVIGGKHLLVGGLEMERAIGEKWGAALFFDAGDAFINFSDAKWPQGIGIGVRRYTAVGPIKIDLARQMGVDDPAFRLHLRVGLGW